MCDYHLRGLDVTAECPECGTAIRESVEAKKVLGERTVAQLHWRIVPFTLISMAAFALTGWQLAAHFRALPGRTVWIMVGLVVCNLAGWYAFIHTSRRYRATGRQYAGSVLTALWMSSIALLDVGIAVMIIAAILQS